MGNRRRIDWVLVAALLFLMSLGVALIYSATAHDNTGQWQKQILFIAVGILTMGILFFVPTRLIYIFAYPLYGISLIPLVYISLMTAGGVERWITLPFGLKFQPSEFAKLALLLALARYLATIQPTLRNIKSLVVPFLLFTVPFLLVLKQPDLSTALVFGAMMCIMLYWAGMKAWELFVMLSPIVSIILTSNQLAWAGFFVLLFAVLWMNRVHFGMLITTMLGNMAAGYSSLYLWFSILKDHQRSRILTFINPMRDPLGEGYQIIQSKVATGSGGLIGKGFGQGTQTNLSFLPEEHTDFIFSVLSEQFGFIGSTGVLMVFLLLIYRILFQTTLVSNPFANLVTVGIAAIFAFHIFINVAMTLGLMPVTGLPLPFLSYGGSFMLTCSIFIGMVLNIRARREQF